MTADPAVLVAGETLVDFLPARPGPAATTETFLRRAGGAPANVAVGLARLGRPPWFWTRVGTDPFGDFLAETLADEGVPRRFVERDPDAPTTLAFVFERDEVRDRSHGRVAAPDDPERTDEVDAEGTDEDDAAFVFYRDGTADTRLRAGTVPDDVLDAVDWCVVGGVALATEPSREAVLDLATRARDRGATVVFDPNARPALWDDDFGAVVDRMLPRADVVSATPADLRAAGLADGEDSLESLARSVVERGPHTTVLTLGAAGAFAVATDGAPWGPATARHDGYAVEAVDATGAGDAFVAGAIVALAEGRSLPAALAFANAVAACATTGPGGMAALPDRARVDALVDG